MTQVRRASASPRPHIAEAHDGIPPHQSTVRARGSRYGRRAGTGRASRLPRRDAATGWPPRLPRRRRSPRRPRRPLSPRARRSTVRCLTVRSDRCRPCGHPGLSPKPEPRRRPATKCGHRAPRRAPHRPSPTQPDRHRAPLPTPTPDGVGARRPGRGRVRQRRSETRRQTRANLEQCWRAAGISGRRARG